MRKKILLLGLFMFFATTHVYGLTYGGCDYSTVSRFKSLVANINISYDYHINNNQAYFDVTLTNIPENVYFLDTLSNKTYTYNDTKDGEITIHNYIGQTGTYKFYLSYEGCKNVSLGSKYYKFPVYNTYYNDPLCSDIPNYSLCQKWVNVKYSYSEFEKIINDYKISLEETPKVEENVEYHKNFLENIIEFYINYYYYFLIAVILVCIFIITIKRRKDRFKL